MTNQRSTTRILLTRVALASALVLACSCAPSWSRGAVRSTALTPDEILSGADVIVVATPVEYRRPPVGGRTDDGVPLARVEFRVIEQLKGWPLPSVIVLHGYLADDADAGGLPASRRASLADGERNGCTFVYRRGATYLLFLKPTVSLPGRVAEGQTTALTPYWCALGPVNEQLRGAEDPWLLWVRRHIHPSDDVQGRGALGSADPGPSAFPCTRLIQ